LTAILSGSGNSSSASGAVICGGGFDGVNTAANTQSSSSFIGGGLNNAGNGIYSGILSGSTNTVGAGSCIVMGGITNSTTGANSFVAGTHVANTTAGSFVWSGTVGSAFNGSAVNSFNVRSPGGSYIVSTTLVGFNTGVMLAPNAGAWSVLSDRNSKENIQLADISLALDLLSSLTIYTWNLITQDPSIIHIGPMAQDVYNVFLHNEDPRFINDADAAGILIACVQRLYERFVITKQLKDRSHEQQIYISHLRKRLELLEDSLLV
jgi:hypothetical protein